MDWPQNRFPPLNTISTLSLESLGATIRALATVPSSVAPGANNALFVPFRMYEPATAVNMLLMNGGTAAGNADLGIYDNELNKIVSSGSIAQSGTNTVQAFDVTDTLLLPGRYFMAVEMSSTGTLFAVNGLADEFVLVLNQAFIQAVGSFPLPTTAAFATSTSATPVIPMLAVNFNSTV